MSGHDEHPPAPGHGDGGGHAAEHDDDDHGHGGGHGHGDDHGEGGHGEPWLVSYADLMTLLFGFFVIMYSFESAKNQDDGTMVKVRRELAQYFGGSYVNPLGPPEQRLREEMGRQGLLKDLTTRLTPEGLEIVIQSSALFKLGSAQLNPQAMKIMGTLLDAVAETKKQYRVRVEGHTDDIPIRASKVYPTNWELSAARASTVVRLFEAAGIDPTHLTAVGFGSTRPMAPNRDADGGPIAANQALNRRVAIFILPELEEKPDPKAPGAKTPSGPKPVYGPQRALPEEHAAEEPSEESPHH